MRVKYKPSKESGKYLIVIKSGEMLRTVSSHTALEFAQKRGIELGKKTGLGYKIIKLIGEIKQN